MKTTILAVIFLLVVTAFIPRTWHINANANVTCEGGSIIVDDSEWPGATLTYSPSQSWSWGDGQTSQPWSVTANWSNGEKDTKSGVATKPGNCDPASTPTLDPTETPDPNETPDPGETPTIQPTPTAYYCPNGTYNPNTGNCVNPERNPKRTCAYRWSGRPLNQDFWNFFYKRCMHSTANDDPWVNPKKEK